MNRLIIIVFFSLLMLVKISCNKSLLAEIPAYIEIQDFNYQSAQENQIPYTTEYHSTNITDAWVTMDGQFLGAFEIPCKIPILLESNQSEPYSFEIHPGIKVNGIAASRLRYPFYEKFEIDTFLNLEKTILLTPKTKYTEQAVIRFETLGEFEDMSNNIFTTSEYPISNIANCNNLSGSNADPIIQNNIVYQGEGSLAINLDYTHNYFHIRTEKIDLQGTTFLELNFKTSTALHAGIIIINSLYEEKEELIQLYPTDNWKKIYLDLTPLIQKGNSYSDFQIYFEGCVEENSTTSSIYIDNLKLVSNE